MTSCGVEHNTNSEIICPNNFRILVKFVKAKDLREAIINSYLEKRRLKTSETYTVAKLKDGRSLAFKQIPPEVAVTCIVQESFVGFADRRYVYFSGFR
jgi:hypothetical protein